MNSIRYAMVALISTWLAAPAVAELPDGPAKPLVQMVCSGCHGVERIERSAGFASAGEWRSFIATMVDLAEPQAQTIAEYLAEHFPLRPERQPRLIGGPVQIHIDEWLAPTLGQRVRDPVEAPDGSIWWTGMWASLVGRLDPATGAIQEYRLPVTARPHSIVPDADGNIWYTGNSNATIGRLNPKTGLITEYPTRGRDPHTAVFHPNGKLYFTAQHAATVGRLDPETGAVDEIDVKARPYGIKVGADGRLWVAHNGANAIAAVHPDSMAVEYFVIPDERTRIRRLDVGPDGRIWYVNSALGRIGRLDPGTGETKEWDSPSGSDSHPYAIAVIDGVIWYNESGKRPDALVRFDPDGERFQSWTLPSGVGIVRNMWVTAAGDLLVHQSSSNRIGRIRVIEN